MKGFHKNLILYGLTLMKMKEAFESFIDMVTDKLKNPKMHVYHYGSFEVSTLKSLAGHFLQIR